MYQGDPPIMATAATLAERMREAADLLLRHADGLTPQERQLLHDLKRTDGRSRFRSLAAMLVVSARCADPSVRFLVPELCRGTIVSATPSAKPVCVVDAFTTETLSEGTANVAQVAHLAARTAQSADAVVRPLLAHREAIGLALDAVHRERIALRAPSAKPPAFYLRREGALVRARGA